MRMRRRSWVPTAGACVFVSLVYGLFFGMAPGSAEGHDHGQHRMAIANETASRGCARITKPRRQLDCRASLLPARHSLEAMGIPDYGGGTSRPAKTRDLDSFTGPPGTPQQRFDITAALGTKEIGGVPRPVTTFNGTTPGPTLTVQQGDLVEVRLRNLDVRRGVTIHWHGVDVPGREDGVAGVTQNAVLPGQEYTYRFIVPDAGTYWYHSHQDSLRQVRMGLIGALVVKPRTPTVPDAGAQDLVGVIHTYGTVLTLNGSVEDSPVTVAPGSVVRARFVNSDSAPAFVSASAPFQVVAIDGLDLTAPTDLSDTYAEIPAGGRVDLLATAGSENIRVGILRGPSFVVGTDPGSGAPPLVASTPFDPLTYGQPGSAAAALDQFGRVTRSFDYRVGQRYGYLDGHYGNWYTINGRMIPDVPMFVVRKGDVVRMRIANDTLAVHPMHLHGHHALVVSRNGRPSTGSAWWVDSLEVGPGESYVLEFEADNPGVWMFHCHNLPHARAGLVTHLMYDGVASPYRIGRVNSRLVNQPE
jgi:FtsP/CotA-like multicopper oxidase with cupredoxin domain